MQSKSRCFGILLIAAMIAGATQPAAGQVTISRFTIDGGGGTNSSGGTFTLGGTIGQPDAGLLSGAGFILGGGFWFGGTPPASSVELPTAPPAVFRMYPATPNPVMERTLIAFDLPAPTVVRAEVYDASGRLVRTLANELLPAGRHERSWDRQERSGQAVPSGVYFLLLNAGSHRTRQKLVVIR